LRLLKEKEMKIAVTGANGHVGVNLCRTLYDQGHDVVALVHTKNDGIRKHPVKIVKGDLLNKDSLIPFLQDAEILFHLAARISITGDKDGMVARINHEGTMNLLEIAQRNGIKRMIHFSSIHAFSQHPLHEPLDETRPLVGKKGFAYDISKAAGEKAVMKAVGNGLDAVILAPTAIIGPSDHEPSLIGQAVIDMIKGKIPSLVPGGYDWVDVRDVVGAAITAMDKGRKGEKYLLSGHWRSLKEFSAAIKKVTGIKTVQTEIPMWVARLGLPFISGYSRMMQTKPLYTGESLTILTEGNRFISHQKAAKELNYAPRALESSLFDLVEWFRREHML